MGRRRGPGKKRGRPKLDRNEEEAVGDFNYGPPTKLSPPLPTPEGQPSQMHCSPLRSRYLTRSKASAGNTATSKPFFRSPLRNVISDLLSQSSPSNQATSDVPLSRKFNSEAAKVQVKDYVETAVNPNNEAKRTPCPTRTNNTVGKPTSAFSENRYGSSPRSDNFQDALHEITSIVNDFRPDGNLLIAPDVALPEKIQESREIGVTSETNANGTQHFLGILEKKNNLQSTENENVSGIHQPSKVIDIASKPNECRAERTDIILGKRERQLSRCSTINYTEIADLFALECSDGDEVYSTLDTAKVEVDGYKVNKEVAPVLRSIISKYGDIAKRCASLGSEITSLFLEMICGICQRLEEIEPGEVTVVEIKAMLGQVQGLEAGGMDVKWLRQHLDDIIDALQVAREYKRLKEAHQRDKDACQRKENELKRELEELERKKKELEAEVASIVAKNEETRKIYLSSKQKMKTLTKKSLLTGIL